LNGLENVKPTVMNSMDFANMQFETIGLKGKWFNLIGDPSTNFITMVFGKPKMGKSYLCIDFAGYLARNHGNVLYVAKEEGLDFTLQKKLNDKDVKHPNLFVASELLDNLHSYQYIFLDSVNKLGLSAEDLTALRKKYPHKSFVFIFQTTKDGNFRGANSFQHDVDVVIEVPERGKAVQMGRFNQGGEIGVW
jgi:predicted ATP-dependent serine protease